MNKAECSLLTGPTSTCSPSPELFSPLWETLDSSSLIYLFPWPCCAAISRNPVSSQGAWDVLFSQRNSGPSAFSCQTLHLAQLNFVLFPLFPPSRSHSFSCLIGWGLSVLTSARTSVSSGNFTMHSSLLCVTEKYRLKAAPRQPSDKPTTNYLPPLLSAPLASTSCPSMPHLSCRDGWGSSLGKDGASP